MPTRALLLALLLVATVPSHALAEAAEERVLIDLTVSVWPAAEWPHCMVLASGTVTATVARARDALEPSPARFTFWGFQADPEAMLQTTVTGTPITTSIHVNGASEYCYTLAVKAPGGVVDADRPTQQRHVQQIAVRITHRPD